MPTTWPIGAPRPLVYTTLGLILCGALVGVWAPPLAAHAGPPLEPPHAAPAVTPPAGILDATLAVFTDGYRELAKVTYETSGEAFYPDSVTLLVPAKALGSPSPEQLKAKACAVKAKLGLDCACESVELGAVKDYAWSAWPDKRVVPVTIRFVMGC